MEFLSRRLKKVNASATAQIKNLVIEKENLGQKIFGLSVGEPDFETPENIKVAAYRAIKNGDTKYTATDGIISLKHAIKNKFLKDNNLSYELNELIVCSGGKQVIFNAFMATINPSDQVIIPAPYWVSYPDITRLCGGTPKIINTRIADGYKLTALALKKTINSNTKWLILNSPTNPTGSVYSLKELNEIAQVVKMFPNVNILSDDIYEHITYENQPFLNIAQVQPSLKERTLILNGVSKSYSMTGWRLGYGAGSKRLIEAMIAIQSQSTSNATSISQHAALEALSGPQHFIEKNKRIFENRRNLLLDILRQSEDIQLLKPMGTFYAFPSIEKLIGKKTKDGNFIKSDTDFTVQLLKETGVAVVPGSAFGAKKSFRISYAVSETLLKTASERIVQFSKTLK